LFPESMYRVYATQVHYKFFSTSIFVTCQDLILTPVIVPTKLQLETVICSTIAVSDPPRLPTLHKIRSSQSYTLLEKN